MTAHHRTIQTSKSLQTITASGEWTADDADFADELGHAARSIGVAPQEEAEQGTRIAQHATRTACCALAGVRAARVGGEFKLTASYAAAKS